MNSTNTRRNTVIAALVVRAAATARRSLQMVIILALALGTILLALSMSVAHAGPGDGPGGSQEPALKPPKLHASENPVVFGPSQTVKWISVTAQPYTAYLSAVIATSERDDPTYQGDAQTILAGLQMLPAAAL